MSSNDLLPTNYAQILAELKAKVRASQAKAATVVNHELIGLYFEIGRQLAAQDRNWGKRVIERLASDLRAAFPEMRGFSRSNLFYMRRVYVAWSEAEKSVQQLVGLIPWGHHLLLVTKVADAETRAWYLAQTVEHGWSRSILASHIETRLHERQGRAVTNFDATLARSESELLQQTLKDPYVFDFLALGSDARERDLEAGLLDHIQRFLLELGVGFAFVGRQVHLEVGGEDFYLDLLFYHLKLRSFVVIELKARPFEPEFAGKLNFYLSAVDDLMRHPSDNATIGILLCKGKNRVFGRICPSRFEQARRCSGMEDPARRDLAGGFAGELALDRGIGGRVAG